MYVPDDDIDDRDGSLPNKFARPRWRLTSQRSTNAHATVKKVVLLGRGMIGVSSLTDRKAPPPRAGGQETGQGNARQTCQAKALSPFIRIRRKREDHFMLARRQGDGPEQEVSALNDHGLSIHGALPARKPNVREHEESGCRRVCLHHDAVWPVLRDCGLVSTGVDNILWRSGVGNLAFEENLALEVRPFELLQNLCSVSQRLRRMHDKGARKG